MPASRPLEIWLHYDGRFITKIMMSQSGEGKLWTNINVQTYTRFPDSDPPWFNG